MRLLIVSSTCSAGKYKEIYEKRNRPMLDSNQKFFLSLIDGLKTIENLFVDCVTTLPISHRCYSEKFVKSEEEVADGVFFHYCGCLNYPIIRTMTVGHNIKGFVRKYLRKYSNEKVIVLCDGLIGEANALTGMLRRRSVPSIALVTDVPDIVSDMNRGKGLRSFLSNVYGKRASKLLKSFDAYVFLTEQMNDVCNPKNKPYMIMECIVTPLDIEALPEEKLAERPVALYAGKLHSDFGVLQLAEAAACLEDVCEVWLYGGQGNCNARLKELAEKHSNLKLHGIVPLEEIHKIERNASILVNPRPNEKVFTKYSFPSKTAEYLMMNVPVVMYKLDGIPESYDKYLHYVETSGAAGIAEKIRAVLAMEPEKRAAISQSGRDFVIQNKNCFNQANRLFEFLKDI